MGSSSKVSIPKSGEERHERSPGDKMQEVDVVNIILNAFNIFEINKDWTPKIAKCV
jgi:hypothetical protein